MYCTLQHGKPVSKHDLVKIYRLSQENVCMLIVVPVMLLRVKNYALLNSYTLLIIIRLQITL